MTRHKFTYRHDEACYLGERYPQQEIIIQSNCDDLNADEILQLFKSYMMACGYAEKSFYDACETASEENPFRKRKENSYSGDGYELGETDEISHSWHDGAFKVHYEKTDQIRTNHIKDMLS
jgi:hypothetical protein